MRNPHRPTQHQDQSKNATKILTRRQNKQVNNKPREEYESPFKNKRSFSSHQFKFLKKPQLNQPEEHNQNKVPPLPKPQKKNSLVFNKFTRQQKQQIRQYLSTIHSLINPLLNPNPLSLIEAYISKLQQNNSKLLQVNYFFQKEFNQMMAEKQLSKPLDKCSKSSCMECRYHLQKQSHWKQQKSALLAQVSRLKQEISQVQTSKYQSKNQSLIQPTLSNSMLVLKYEQQVQEKEEQYLILVKEFNYLDTHNKQLKNKLGSLMEQNKYLSIENRTLRNTKAQLLGKVQECSKYKEERDYFKKKVIEQHNMKKCRCSNKQAESIFSLSSASNPSLINNLQPQQSD